MCGGGGLYFCVHHSTVLVPAWDEVTSLPDGPASWTCEMSIGWARSQVIFFPLSHPFCDLVLREGSFVSWVCLKEKWDDPKKGCGCLLKSPVLMFIAFTPQTER